MELLEEVTGAMGLVWTLHWMWALSKGYTLSYVQVTPGHLWVSVPALYIPLSARTPPQLRGPRIPKLNLKPDNVYRAELADTAGISHVWMALHFIH